MQGHKDAACLKNKPFPHFDELAIIFGRDRATGVGAEAPADAVENIEVEEATAKAALEAYNAINVNEDDEDFFNEVNLENIQESIIFSNIDNNDSSIGVVRRPKVQGELEMAKKKQKTKKGNETDDTFFKNIAKLGEICEGVNEEIGKLANCFQHLVDNVKRKMQVYDVIVARGEHSVNSVKKFS